MDKWDKRFLRLAREVSSWSKDPSTKVGAVFVSPDRKDVILGYNGFPEDMEDDPELYSNRDEKYSRIIHGEMNAMMHAKRSLKGYTLYTWPFLSCDRCCVHMMESGITRAVAPLPTPEQNERWGPMLEKTRKYYRNAKKKHSKRGAPPLIEVVEYDLAKVSLD